MLPTTTLPPSLAVLLACFQPCFTAPTFEVFRALVGGTLAATGRRTVCGMLVGAGLSRVWHHDRAHRFFSHAPSRSAWPARPSPSSGTPPPATTPADVTEHRERAPWYTTKTNPSTADMLSKLRRVLIAAKYQVARPGRPTTAEIHAIRLAWDTDAA